jgi:hypothetical protein
MASRPWDDSDVAFLKTLAERRDWFDEAKPRFGDRTDAAVRCMMQKVRQELGLAEGRFMENAWMADAANGTRRLFDALMLTGLRP